MLVPNLVIFYVKDPAKSTEFYNKLFETKPAATFPKYVSYSFDNGFQFALWSTSAKDFVSGGQGNRAELSFMVKDENEVQRLYDLWKEMKLIIEQDLHQAVFGPTFVINDIDGHRIRVCIPD